MTLAEREQYDERVDEMLELLHRADGVLDRHVDSPGELGLAYGLIDSASKLIDLGLDAERQLLTAELLLIRLEIRELVARAGDGQLVRDNRMTNAKASAIVRSERAETQSRIDRVLVRTAATRIAATAPRPRPRPRRHRRTARRRPARAGPSSDPPQPRLSGATA